ncbi:MAG: hypothetical protein E3J21_08415 [Anaerolineales bacterium]|nr:MAG: hypothetical protein E3J21_08415 [Anaerolineales bacterium]
MLRADYGPRQGERRIVIRREREIVIRREHETVIRREHEIVIRREQETVIRREQEQDNSMSGACRITVTRREQR